MEISVRQKSDIWQVTVEGWTQKLNINFEREKNGKQYVYERFDDDVIMTNHKPYDVWKNWDEENG